jgi:hypothetical protein
MMPVSHFCPVFIRGGVKTCISVLYKYLIMQTTKHANKLFSADMLRGYMLAVFMALFSALKIKTSF